MPGLTLEALEDQLTALDMRHIETRAMLYAYQAETQPLKRVPGPLAVVGM